MKPVFHNSEKSVTLSGDKREVIFQNLGWSH